MIPIFSHPLVIFQGVFAGLIFGFLLHKGRVCRFDVIVGQILLKDFTMIKVMFTAILVGSVGFYMMYDAGLITSIEVGPTTFGVVLGGLIFGIGMAILGYCPGTVLAAAGEGACDAVWGIVGMLVGGALYAEVYPLLQQFLPRADAGRTTLARTMGISHWWIIFVLLVAFLVFLLFFGKEKRRRIP